MSRPKSPIRSLLPEREIKICARLRELRLGLKLTQSEFGEQLGLSRESVASYEDARVPLKTGMALRLCTQFIVSERWLATGQASFKGATLNDAPFSVRDTRMCVGLIDEKSADDIDKDMLFSVAFDQCLARLYEERYAKNPSTPRLSLSMPANVAAVKNTYLFLLDYWLSGFEDMEKGRMLSSLICVGALLDYELHAAVSSKGSRTPVEDIIFEIAKNVDAFDNDEVQFLHLLAERRAAAYAENDLTDTATSEKLAVVKPKLPALLERLNRATSETGKMSALADFLKVPLASVSRWLSGKREPGGEITLRLLHWVEQQERQK